MLEGPLNEKARTNRPTNGAPIIQIGINAVMAFLPGWLEREA
jgi:hypothetical protein